MHICSSQFHRKSAQYHSFPLQFSANRHASAPILCCDLHLISTPLQVGSSLFISVAILCSSIQCVSMLLRSTSMQSFSIPCLCVSKAQVSSHHRFTFAKLFLSFLYFSIAFPHLTTRYYAIASQLPSVQLLCKASLFATIRFCSFASRINSPPLRSFHIHRFAFRLVSIPLLVWSRLLHSISLLFLPSRFGSIQLRSIAGLFQSTLNDSFAIRNRSGRVYSIPLYFAYTQLNSRRHIALPLQF